MRYLRHIFESFHEQPNITKMDSIQLSEWSDAHDFDDFKKEDCLLVFEIFNNLDEKIFGPWSLTYPFGKSHDIKFHMTNPKRGEPAVKKLDWFNGHDTNNLSYHSRYFFESSKFHSIVLSIGTNYTEIGITKFQDEWYTISVYSSRYGELCYLCDSVEGLKEMTQIVDDLYNQDWEVVE